MSTPPINSTPTFGQLLHHVMQLKGMNQNVLSHRVDMTPSYLSKLMSDQRDLSSNLANKLADVLGGSADGWMAAFKESASGVGRPLALQVADLLRGQALGIGLDQDFLGTPVRQLRKHAILQVFDAKPDSAMESDLPSDACCIVPFDPLRVKATSYDTRAGSIGIKRRLDGTWAGDPVENAIKIGPHETKIIGTNEHISLPSWLEAELHEASNIALKPLIVSHGPIIDPGWSGRLYVSVYNPTNAEIEISTEEPFLTLRFWVAEQSAAVR